MRETTIQENLESRNYANETRARRELYTEISDLFDAAQDFPDVSITTKGSNKELVSFDHYAPVVINERRDPKAYPAGFIVDLFAEITCPEKLRLIDVYRAEDQITIKGPTEQVRELYSKWIKNN